MYRLANDIDSADASIAEALLKLQEYAKAYDWAQDIDFLKALESVYETIAEGNAYIVDGLLVLVNEFSPWYSNTKVLQEWLVLRVYPSIGDGVAEVPKALREIAKHRGCATLITADSSPISIVADAYKAAGFQPLTRSFFKKVQDGATQ